MSAGVNGVRFANSPSMLGAKKIMWAGIYLGLATLAVSCGKAVTASTSQQETQNDVPVQGVAGFGSQCAFGSIKDPTPIPLQSQNCNIHQKSIHLSQPLLPFILQADCAKMEITARTISGTRIENRWNALPDGRFSFAMDAGNAMLADDGAGHSGCETPLVLEVNGLLNCKDRDHAEIQVDATWHMGQTMPGTTPRLDSIACSLPSGCALHGFADLNQCS
jgi:hypothetical protein